MLLARVAPLDQTAVVRWAEDVEANSGQAGQIEELVTRTQVLHRGLPGLHPLEGLARGLCPGQAEVAVEVQQGLQLSGGSSRGRRVVSVGELGGSDDPVQPLLLALAQLVRKLVLRVLGPGEPDLADFEGVEDRSRLQESGQVIPVLVSDDEPVELPVRRVVHALSHVLHPLLGISRSLEHAAVDEEMALAVPVGAGEQEAVAEALPVHADAQLQRPALEPVQHRKGFAPV